MNIKNTTCTSIRKHLCSELDEGINSAGCRALQKHLKICPECSRYLKDLKKTIQLYRLYPEVKIARARQNQLLRCIFSSGLVKNPIVTRRKSKKSES